MPDIIQLREDLKKIQEKVREKLPEIAILLTISVKAIAERNIKEKGFGVMYSEKKVPAWFLSGKERNATGEAFIKDKEKKKEKTNWKELRQAQGMQTSFVDLSYENQMWANMQPGPVENDGDIVRAPLAATNKEVQNKMNWNRDRYGDFIGRAITPENYATLVEIPIVEIGNILTEGNFITT